MITQIKLADDLKNLGLKQGNIVYVHTSLKNIGPIQGGAITLIEALMDVLGPEGTFAVPTHTLCLENSDLGPAPFNKSSTSCKRIVGTFPDIVWQYPGAKRSGHGSHSSAAIGMLADYLTKDHDPCDAFGTVSPIRKLYDLGGKVLLLGVGHASNTIIHLAEQLAKMPYIKLRYVDEWGDHTVVEDDGGNISRYKQVSFGGCSARFDIADQLLGDKITRAKVGDANCALMNARELVDATIKALQADSYLLLCNNSWCKCCFRRRALLQELGIAAPT